MSNPVQSIKNYYFPSETLNQPVVRRSPGSKDVRKNLSYYPIPVQFQRLRQDLGSWRDAIVESELPLFPQRVKMQRIYQDTIINGHVKSCMNRRKNLTLLRQFKICDRKGIKSDVLTDMFMGEDASNNKVTAPWFSSFQSYALDAPGFGYTLISLGDIENNAFLNLTIIPRQSVSPERLVVKPSFYALGGIPFLEEPYADWHVWVPTPTELGVSPCGYGYLYSVAYYEIFIKNNMGYNADFIELFGKPIRVGKTTKTEESERAEFAQYLENMGSSAWMLLDDGQDELQLLESRIGTGSGYQSYSDFEKRCEAKITKLILGHADALDSTPGKLGAGQGEDSPVSQALTEIQVADGRLVQNIINGSLLPKMRTNGFRLPMNYHFEYENDDEAEEFRRREDQSNQATATIAETMKNAGLQMDAKYFSDRTGIPTEAIAAQPAPGQNPNDPNNPEDPKLLNNPEQ